MEPHHHHHHHQQQHQQHALPRTWNQSRPAAFPTSIASEVESPVDIDETDSVLHVDRDFQYFRRVQIESEVHDVDWRRPRELTQELEPSGVETVLVDGTASRCDPCQGGLGDCWYLSASAIVAMHPEMFANVVPPGQDFSRNYIGRFTFKFWQYGTWTSVEIDDLLPTYRGSPQMIYCQARLNESNTKMVYWPSLLEKAYAKLNGSYDALVGGQESDALVDLTGGVGHVIFLEPTKIPTDFFKHLLRVFQMNTLLGSGTYSARQKHYTNGIVDGHAYSITGVTEVRRSDDSVVQLVRLRNPFGEKEFTGAWSRGDYRWNDVDPRDQARLGVGREVSGEFWMGFDEWVDCFSTCFLCHIPGDEGATVDRKNNKWQQLQYQGTWDPSQGSIHPNNDEYWQNPQYMFTLQGGVRHSVVISLMQEYNRINRRQEAVIAFDLYKVTGNARQSRQSGGSRQPVRLGLRVNIRENSSFFLLDDGSYLIVAATESPTALQFLLRVFTENGVDNSWEPYDE